MRKSAVESAGFFILSFFLSGRRKTLILRSAAAVVSVLTSIVIDSRIKYGLTKSDIFVHYSCKKAVAIDFAEYCLRFL